MLRSRRFAQGFAAHEHMHSKTKSSRQGEPLAYSLLLIKGKRGSMTIHFFKINSPVGAD
jgi:hypothetical protein